MVSSEYIMRKETRLKHPLQVPPYLAYYGAVSNVSNATDYLRSAHHQCAVYREVLYDADASLWEHILLGNFQFTNHWGTGARLSSTLLFLPF